MNQKQILEDMDTQFDKLHKSWGTFIQTRTPNTKYYDTISTEFHFATDDYRRWMPDQIVDPVELVHQIEVK